MLSIRCSPEDEHIIKEYAASKDQTVSEFLREAALEKIEEEYDLAIVEEYLKKKKEIVYYTADEVDKELGL